MPPGTVIVVICAFFRQLWTCVIPLSGSSEAITIMGEKSANGKRHIEAESVSPISCELCRQRKCKASRVVVLGLDVELT